MVIRIARLTNGSDSVPMLRIYGNTGVLDEQTKN